VDVGQHPDLARLVDALQASPLITLPALTGTSAMSSTRRPAGTAATTSRPIIAAAKTGAAGTETLREMLRSSRLLTGSARSESKSRSTTRRSSQSARLASPASRLATSCSGHRDRATGADHADSQERLLLAGVPADQREAQPAHRRVGGRIGVPLDPDHVDVGGAQLLGDPQPDRAEAADHDVLRGLAERHAAALTQPGADQVVDHDRGEYRDGEHAEHQERADDPHRRGRASWARSPLPVEVNVVTVK
jgi:hypothetical protein